MESFPWSLLGSVPDKKGVSGQKPHKVSYDSQQSNRKFWWEQWEFELLEFLVKTMP